MKRLVRILMLWFVRLIGIPGMLAASQQARKDAAQPTPSPRILLIRPDHLGDMVLTTPVLQALRSHAPQAHIHMMVGAWSSEVVARHPAIDRLLTCPFPGFQRSPQKALEPYILLFRTAQQLRRGHYDLAINLRPDFWWGAALLYLARISGRVGYAIEPGTPFLTHALSFQATEHATVSNLRLTSEALRIMGYSELEEPYTPEQYPLHFVPTDDERAWLTERLQAHGIDAETSVVVIHPGTGAAVKLWRPEAWSHLANTLNAASVRIVLTGSKHERSMLEMIAGGMATPPLLITDATVGQLAALLGRAQLVLGVDNGPLHLAVAQGTSTVQLFGPTDIRIFGPWGPAERHSVITSTQRCPTCPTIPCGRLDFSPEEVAAHPCVRLITERQVEDVVMSLIGRTVQIPGQ